MAASYRPRARKAHAHDVVRGKCRSCGEWVGVTPTPVQVAADKAEGVLQVMPLEVLTAIARGEIDLNAIARAELGNRGLDRSGAWVGFPEALRLAQELPVRGADGRVLYVSVPDSDGGRDE